MTSPDSRDSSTLDWPAPDPAAILAPAARPAPAQPAASERTPELREPTLPQLMSPEEEMGSLRDGSQVDLGTRDDLIPVGDEVDELPPAPVDSAHRADEDVVSTVGERAGARHEGWAALLADEVVAEPEHPLPPALPLAEASEDGESPAPAPGGALAPLSAQLRSLLTEALEDDSEQEDLAGSLAEVRQQLDRLRETLSSELADLPGTLRSSVDTAVADAVAAALPDVVDAAAERAVSQSRAGEEDRSVGLETLHSVNTSLRALGTQNAELSHAVSEIASAGSGVESEALASVEDGVRTIGSAQEAVVESLARLEARESLAPDALGGVEEKVSALTDALARLEARPTLAPEALGEVEARVSTLTAAQEAVVDSLARLESRESLAAEALGGVEEKVSSLTDALARLEARPGLAPEALESVQERISALTTSQEAVVDSLARLEARPGLEPEAMTAVHSVLEALASRQREISESLTRVEETRVLDVDALAAALLSQVAPVLAEEVRTQVQQLSDSLEAQLRAQRQSAERRAQQIVVDVNAHVDQAIVTLAQTLLRRRRSE